MKLKSNSFAVSPWSICLLAVVSFQVNKVNAATFVLDDAQPALADGLNNGDTLSSGGIDLTFSNVVTADGSSIGDVEGVGILISGTTDSIPDVISFDFSFSQNVQIETYDIGTREDVPGGSFFTVTGPNGTSGGNTIPAGTLFSETTHNFVPGTIPVFLAGQAYSFTHNLPSAGDPLFNLEQLVVTNIPEPSACCLLLMGCLMVSSRRKRA